MDRSYLAPHSVDVYESRAAKTPLRTVSVVPHSSGGFDNYLVDGVMLKGYVDVSGPIMLTKVYLDDPVFGADGFPR